MKNGNPNGNPNARAGAAIGALIMKDYRYMEGTCRSDEIAREFASVLELAARDARFDFEARIKIRPAENPILNHLGSGVSWVDYKIVLDDSVGARHEEAGVIPKRERG